MRRRAEPLAAPDMTEMGNKERANKKRTPKKGEGSKVLACVIDEHVSDYLMGFGVRPMPSSFIFCRPDEQGTSVDEPMGPGSFGGCRRCPGRAFRRVFGGAGGKLGNA